MTNLYKANMNRILKNPLFIGGCIIAFLVTYTCVAGVIDYMGLSSDLNIESRMYFVSIAMTVFFTIFVPLYTNMEYRYGTIRNKLVAGYSQKQVYLSQILGYFSALAIMTAVYLLAGILGGARDFGKVFIPCAVYFLSLCGYIAFMMLISFRITRAVFLSLLAFGVLNVSYSITMIGNFMISFVLKGVALKIGIIVYNMTPIGQWMIWFMKLMFGEPDPKLNLESPAQILISVVVTIVMMLLATAGINKRDLK